MRVKLIQRSLLVSVLAFVPSFAQAVDVPKWSTYDINFASSTSYSNGYAYGPSTPLSATFTGPGGITQTVSGFWNGGTNFDIRFTPTVEGSWSYTTSCSDGSLNGKTGTINATAANAGDHGFLRVDPDYKNSFVWDDGTRYFMWGQTYYDLMQAALVNNNYKTSVDNSLSYGLSKIRFEVYACDIPVEHNVYPDAQPYTGTSTSPNRNVLNLTYWQKLDEVVQYMDSKGMVADLIVTNPYRDGRVFGTDTQNDRFVNYVRARYAAYTNVTWCVTNEWNYATDGTYPQNQADFNRMGALLRNNDPWMTSGTSLRPLSTHQQTRIDFQFFNAAWPTHAVIQYSPRNGVTNNGDEWGNAGIVYNLGHNMPVVNDEYAYPGEVNDGQLVTQTIHRNAMWGVAVAGGYGSTADFYENPTGTGIPESTGDWADGPQYTDIKNMVDFFTTTGLEYWKMASHNELTSGARTYVLAEPGRQYVAYAAVGGSFSLNLAPGTYSVSQYNPRTGQTTVLANVSGGTRPFTMPDSSNDWVLRLTNTAPPAASIGLISAVKFDGNSNNSVAGAANGTRTGTTSFVTGQIGQAVKLDVTANDGYIDFGTGSDVVPLTGDTFGGSRGLWTGTQSMWVNTTQDIYVAGGKNIACARIGDTNLGWYAGYNHLNGLTFYLNGPNSHGFSISADAANQIQENSGWHLITATYNLTTGGLGTGTGQIYVDGVLQAATIYTNTVLSSDVMTAGGRSVLGADINPSNTVLPAEGYKGSIDDYGVFNTQLSATQVAALYNLGWTGVSGTKYGITDAAALFDAFLNEASATTGDTKSWTYVGSGLSGAAGSVGASYVVLSGSGGGMQLTPTAVDVTWTGLGGTTWSTVIGSNNWKKTSDGTSADYVNGTAVTFNDTATGLTANISAADVTPTSVTFNNSDKNFTITGTKGIAGSTTTVLKQGTGTVTIGSVNTYGGVTTVEAGTLILQGNAKAMVPVLNNGGADIKGGMLVLDYSTEADPVATVRSLLTASYLGSSGNHFNIGKFLSSTADSTRGLGWIDNTTTSKISVAFTIYGDANLDGTANFADLSKLLSDYNQAGVWVDGDFNYDGVVDFADLSKLLSTYNQSIGTLTPAPEPSSLILLSTMIGLAGALTIRRRGR